MRFRRIQRKSERYRNKREIEGKREGERDGGGKKGKGLRKVRSKKDWGHGVFLRYDSTATHITTSSLLLQTILSSCYKICVIILCNNCATV